MRLNPTVPEALLWESLSKARGVAWKAQEVLRGWIADFWCEEVLLIVEVDGPSHKGQQEHDAFRDATLGKLGILTLRFGNTDVLRRRAWVLRKIREAVRARRR